MDERRDMPYDRQAIGRRIKSGLADRGETNEDLATGIGVSRYTVDSWVSGRNGMSLENAYALADYFCWPLDQVAVRELAGRN